VQEKLTILKYFGDVNIKIAHNLPDLHQPTFCSIDKVKGELKLVFIARIVEIKNLKLLLDNLLLVKSVVDVTIAGPIGDNIYWASCLSVIEQMPDNITIIYIGEIMPADILPLIQKNHLYCLPTQSENFGHSIFESFMIGRPVLISNQTPWLDLNNKKAGWDINLNNKNAFVPYIEKAANWQQKQFDIYCRGARAVAHDYMNNPTLISDYNQLFN
jgi:glycosyltransferase involved in cell wall biosynthesis